MNLKNAEKINEIGGSLQSDSERRGSSAAESQGMAQNYICQCLVLCGWGSDNVPNILNLVPRVLWPFSQRVVASRDSGLLEFYYRRFSAVKQWSRYEPLRDSQSKNLNKIPVPQRLYWRPPADQKARGLWVRDCNVLGAARFTNVDCLNCL